MTKNAIITGAGTGVGRHTAILLSQAGWNITLTGRTEKTLQETMDLAGADASNCQLVIGSVADESFVAELNKKAEAKFGVTEVLVNSAGTNTPARTLDVLSMADYHDLINTNLHGCYYAIQAVLPAMRKAKSGTIVNIVSDASLWGMPLAGAAYTISKFGLRGLTQAINAEENKNSIRAIGILPGEINTPILKLRPNEPTAAHKATMLLPEDVAACAKLAIDLPSRAVVQELLVRPCR
ncbi:MAG: SDR family oxidoreductase [Verrucomicrobia bacterium]|nr:SDR family oxidoreductase [Verrucomicrobiota bacterium]